MDTAKNPFTPAFGTMPRVLAGRHQLEEQMQRAFEEGLGNPNLSTILIGARGSGKTVLLARIREIATEQGWLCASTTALPGMLEDIYEQARLASEHLTAVSQDSRLTSVSIGPIGASWDPAERVSGNWRTRMTHLLEEIAAFDTGLLITVDEATATLDEMRQLAAVYQHFVTEGRKVALVIAGLPYHVNQLISDESVSFLRRATQVVLQRISDADIAYAFVHTLESAGKDAQEPAVSACVRAIDGFPYMLQLVGYRVWLESGSARTVTEELAQRGIQAATVDLQEQILAATYRNLSPGDVRFLEAMAQDEQESRISEIAQRMDVGNNYAANYKKRLLAQGVIDEPARSIVRFSIPGMREYVLARKDN